MSFKAIHELRGKARCSDRRPFTVAVRLEKKPPCGQHVALAARLKQVTNPDGFGLCRGIALHVQEALPEFGREALTGKRYDEDINLCLVRRTVVDTVTQVVVEWSTAAEGRPQSEQDRRLAGVVLTDEVRSSWFKVEPQLVYTTEVADD